MAVHDLYPFGADFDQSLDRVVGLNGKYSYQGKEFISDLGLNLYEFGARGWDPLLGRWHVPDPQRQFASPYLGMGNNPVMMVDPNGEFAFVPVLLIAAKAAAIGAGLSAAGYTASVGFSDGGFSNWNWGQFGKSAAIGAVSGVATAGIGSAFGVVGGGASGFGGQLAYEATRAATHGLSNLAINAAFGNQVNGATFAAGAIGSLVGSGLDGFSTAAQIGGAALSGGIGAELTGGDFFRGAATGATVAGLNHGVHGLINLASRKAGQQLVERLRKIYEERKPVNLEDVIDIDTRLSDTYGC